MMSRKCSAATLGNGRSQPPKNSVVATDETTIMFAYSARKKSANRMPLYSVWNPPVNSCSASGRSNGARLVSARLPMKKMTKALRPWTFDFHVAQNDATVRGSGTHDKTGKHCMAPDPNGKLNIARDAGYWLRDDSGKVTKKFRHICWDGCMFPNETLMLQQTWNDILAAMVQVRENHGWRE